MWWLLAREVLMLRGKINTKTGFVLNEKVIMPDLYFHRETIKEEEKEEELEDEIAPEPMEQEPEVVPEIAPIEQPAPIAPVPEAPLKMDFRVQAIDDWAAPRDKDNKGGSSW